MKSGMCHFLAITTVISLAAPSASFKPSSIPLQSRLPALRFSNGDASETKAGAPSLSPIVTEQLTGYSVILSGGKNEQEILLPFPVERPAETSQTRFGAQLLGHWKNTKHYISNQVKVLRPSQRFRIRVGLAAVALFLATSALRPQMRLMAIIKAWIAARGFQGVSALGRSIAYGWALLVAYPKMLDRRASERRKREEERRADQRRQQLARLVNEITRLRHELATIDAEIRSFRREIITMKAYANKSEEGPDAEVQEAISVEMKHLAQLRSDTKARLAAAREAWAERRANSAASAWEEEVAMVSFY